MSAKQIIIPKGTVGPNDTLVIDIPATPISKHKFITARRLDYSPSPSSFQHNYSLVPTRTGSPSRQRYQDDSSYWEGEPVFENRIDLDDSSLRFSPYNSRRGTTRSSSPDSPFSGGGSFRRTNAVGNLAQLSGSMNVSYGLDDERARSLGTPRGRGSNLRRINAVGNRAQSAGPLNVAYGLDAERASPLGGGNLRRMNAVGNLAQSAGPMNLTYSSLETSGSSDPSSAYSAYGNLVQMNAVGNQDQTAGSRNIANGSYAIPRRIGGGNLRQMHTMGNLELSPMNVTYRSLKTSAPNSMRSGYGNLRRMQATGNLDQLSGSMNITGGNYPNPQRIGGGNLRRMQAMGNLDELSGSRSILDGSYPSPQRIGVGNIHAGSYPSPQRIGVGRSDSSLSQRAPSPHRRAQSTASIIADDNRILKNITAHVIREDDSNSARRFDATYNQTLGEFLPARASTPVSGGADLDFMPTVTSTPVRRKLSFFRTETPSEISAELEEFSEDDYYEDSSMYDSSEMEEPAAPRSTTRRKITRTIKTPTGTSEEILEEETSDDQNEMYDSSEMLDSSEERMNDSMMEKVIGGDMGRVLIYPTPPGQPSGTGRRVHLSQLARDATTDRKSVQFKSTNSGVSYFSNHSISQPNATYDRSSLGILQPDQMNSTFSPGNRTRTMEDSGSLGLMRSSQMQSGLPSGRPRFPECPCQTLFGSKFDSLGLMNSNQMQSGLGSGSLGLMRSGQMQSDLGSGSLGLLRSGQMEASFADEISTDLELSYDNFNPRANSSETDLESLEAREQNSIEADLRAWQDARRQFLADMTTFSASY